MIRDPVTTSTPDSGDRPDAPTIGLLRWLLRFGAAFLLLNTLLSFETRWPGIALQWAPRLSF